MSGIALSGTVMDIEPGFINRDRAPAPLSRPKSSEQHVLFKPEYKPELTREFGSLKGQPRESSFAQRAPAGILESILYSTDIAIVFLDCMLKIRFFTPATAECFRIIPGDIGRPMTDLASFVESGALSADAHAVIESETSRECKIAAAGRLWIARLLPYRALDYALDGILITFTDLTGRLRPVPARPQPDAEPTSGNDGKLPSGDGNAGERMETLTARQRAIMQLVLAGHPTKNIAADLGISQRTVEKHRAAVMAKTGAKSLPTLTKLAIAAGVVSLSCL